MSVVSNSSPLIGLSTIGQLDLLKALYGTIDIPAYVYYEVVTKGAGRPGSREVARANWIHRHTVTNQRAIKQLLAIPNLQRGESETIILAAQLSAQLIILDERPARREATARKLTVTGTGGILAAAKQQGLISVVKPLLDALIANGLHVHPSVYQAVLHSAGE